MPSSRGPWSPSFGSKVIVSYSQNAEDVRLWRAFRDVEQGFYVDVGASDPRIDSVTHLFYERGWSGINVEPSPTFEALAAARTRDVNLRVAVGESEESIRFFVTAPYLGMSAVDPAVHADLSEAIDRIEEAVVPQRRLDSILREHAPSRTIHFLKIDVEGAEARVLASSDWTSFRPLVVVVESIQPWSTSSTHHGWEPILTQAGYRFAAFDGINRFYVAGEHADLIPVLAYPVSALDRYVTARERETDDRLARVEAELEETKRELERLEDARPDRHRWLALLVGRVRVADRRIRRSLSR